VIQIDKEIDTAVTIDVDTVDGTATTGDNDYDLGDSTETFAADTAANLNDQTTTVTVNGDHADERHTGAGNRNNETFTLRLSAISASGRSVQFSGMGASLDGTGTIQNDDYDTQVAVSDTNDPSENGEDFDVAVSVTVVTVMGASNPLVPVFTDAITVSEPTHGVFDAKKDTSGSAANVTFTDAFGAPLRNGTITAAFAASTEAGGSKRRFNASDNTTMHVVNNIPKFALRTGMMTVDGTALGYNGPNIAVQNANNPFDVEKLIELVHPDEDGDTMEGSQEVSFTVTTTVVSAATMDPDDYVAVRPAVATLAPASFGDTHPASPAVQRDLTFTGIAGQAAILEVSVVAVDDGVGGVGVQQSAAQTFCLSLYGVQPFPGDVVIADRGSRVYSGEVLLVHDSMEATALGYPTENLINDQLVDSYEIAVHTNTVAGKELLEYLVIDYETIFSNKGRGRQGLFGVNSVSGVERLISSGQQFSIPVAVDVLPDRTGLTDAAALEGHIVIGDSGSSDADPGKIILIDPSNGNQTLLTQGNELLWLTGMTVSPNGQAHEGMIYTTDIGNIFGQTAYKNNNPRKIIQIDPATGTQTVLVAETNNFAPSVAITNLWHPTGIDIDPATGDLYIVDSFSKTIWQLAHNGDGTFPTSGINDATVLTAFSLDDDFIQPVHIAVATDGSALYVTDGATIAPGAPYAAGTRFLHKVAVPGGASTPYSTDGFFKEPRGLEIIPEDPLTGN